MLPDASNIKAISMTAGHSGKEKKKLLLDSNECLTEKLYFVYTIWVKNGGIISFKDNFVEMSYLHGDANYISVLGCSRYVLQNY